MHRGNQNCVSYRHGKCLHQAAPRKLLGSNSCILDSVNSDPRVQTGCRLQVEHVRPKPPNKE